MFKIIGKFTILSIGLSVILHILFNYFGVYRLHFKWLDTNDLLMSLTFAIAFVASVPDLSKKKMGDLVQIAIALFIGLYLSFYTIGFVLEKLF